GSYDEAARLYRGDFMSGFRLPDAPAFEEWMLVERERLRQHARECHRASSERKLQEGDHAGALDQALRLLALEPWHESSQRLVMRLHARQGQFEAALQQYESCRSVLERELGVEPTLPTKRLRDRIIAARQRPAARLPLLDSKLVGREAELSKLRGLLARPECRLITISGTGGVGKSRLALELARGLTGEFLEGVCFVPLVAVHDRDGLLEALMAALEVEQRTGADPEESLVEELQARETLLLLDNFEQLVEVGTDLLVTLLDGAPGLKILVTSRSRLNLKREWLVGLNGLDFPLSEVAREAGTLTDAELLFAQTSDRVGVSPAESPDEAAAVARICRLVEGHPLAIELAASGRWRMTAAEIADSISHGIEALGSDARDLPERFRSVLAVFDHSWRLLSEAERSSLERLAVCAGGFTAHAAAELAGADERSLDSLVSKSLLRRSNDARLEFHPLVREFALSKLTGRPSDLARAGRLHAEYYLERVREALIRRWEEDQSYWAELLRREQDNLRAALTWAEENDAGLGLGLVRRLWGYWRQWGQFREGRRWLEAMLAAAPAGELLSERSEALNGAASLAFLEGDNEAAKGFYLESLELRRAQGDEQGVAMVLNNLANVIRREGDLEAAAEYYCRSLEIRERLGDDQGVASTLSNLGLTAERRGELEQAHDLYRRSLDIRRRVNDLEGVVIALCNLGFVTSKQRHYQVARSWFRQSIELERELGGRRLLDDSLAGLATVEAALGSPKRAALLLGAAETLRRTTGKALDNAEEEELEDTLARLRENLPHHELESALQAGRELTLDRALKIALGDEEGDG
ncbi:MAG TPA: tetratricopeptide repeat protein, partial [Trueperaceae bacterium]